MRTIAALVFLFSAQAFACPQLTGNFVCTFDDGTVENVSITQSEDKAGVVTYVYAGTTVPADNVARTIPDDETLKGGTFRAWCEDDVTLKSEILGKYWNNGSYFGDLQLNGFYSMENGDLKQTVTGSVTTATDKYPVDSTTVCTKAP